IRTLGCFDVRKRWQAKVAIASSEPCMRLDIRTAPSTRMMYSLSRRTSFNVVPSGETVWSSSSKGFTRVMLQQVGYWMSGDSLPRVRLIALTENADGDKKRALARSQAPLYNSNLQIPQGSPPSRQVRRLKPELFLSRGILKCLQTLASFYVEHQTFAMPRCLPKMLPRRISC